MTPGAVLEVGDVMRWSRELVEAVQANDRDVLVRVTRIERASDGTVTLWLENADRPPLSGVVN